MMEPFVTLLATGVFMVSSATSFRLIFHQFGVASPGVELEKNLRRFYIRLSGLKCDATVWDDAKKLAPPRF